MEVEIRYFYISFTRMMWFENGERWRLADFCCTNCSSVSQLCLALIFFFKEILATLGDVEIKYLKLDLKLNLQ